MVTDRDLLIEYVANQQPVLTTLVNDWIADNAERLLMRDFVVIGPVTSDGAELLYRTLAAYRGFERQIMKMTVSRHRSEPSGDFFGVRFIGDLEQPDQTAYQIWVSGQIEALDRRGLLDSVEPTPSSHITSWGQSLLEMVSELDDIVIGPAEMNSVDVVAHMRAEQHYRRTGQWIRPDHTTTAPCAICKAIEDTLDPESSPLY